MTSKTNQARVAIIGTGGTIASKGQHPLELLNYIDHADIYTASELVEATPTLSETVSPVIVPFSAVASQDIEPSDWLRLAKLINSLDGDDVSGIVVTHGTATLEETAWFLNLTVKTRKPVVVVGAQRPHTGLSTDAHLNLVNAARLAACPDAVGLGVLVCLNDEIHAAREVTKTSTMRLHTFRSPDFGILGQVDHDGINIYRQPIRRHAPDTEFDIHNITELPRVDIVYSYAGADETTVNAFIAAGTKAIIVAGFAPGLVTRSMQNSLTRAAQQGIYIVQSSRAGSGRVTPLKTKHAPGTIMADNLNPQKARILTMLALIGAERSTDRREAEIEKIFKTY